MGKHFPTLPDDHFKTPFAYSVPKRLQSFEPPPGGTTSPPPPSTSGSTPMPRVTGSGKKRRGRRPPKR